MATTFTDASLISTATLKNISCGSAIRKVFTQGLELKKIYGADKVFDFSLGNPALEPPAEVQKAIEEVAHTHYPLCHGYMPNQGLLECREAIAQLVGKLQGVKVDADRVLVSSGAAGAANVVFKTIITPGDEVIQLAPYFVEYEHYVNCFGGVAVTVPTKSNYDIDVDAIAAAITPHTRAILMNSPNNPTGKIYSQDNVNALGQLLLKKSKEIGRPIYLLSDDPYARITYGGKKSHSTFQAYDYSFVVSSFSKDLSIPGERIGYLVSNPNMPGWDKTVKPGLIFCQRTLGFVNANAFMQRVVAKCAMASVDASWYDARRIALCEGLRAAGMILNELPEGAFYAFPKIPGSTSEDDFVQALTAKNVLVVPGSAFGAPGYVRLCYAVPMETITRALPHIKEVVDSFKAK
eukprot:TRINITY_DN113_c0_g2_i1.p1 TRINITY_DN113_c0_g2~~TRINITY_DN113_c0_g2_i1.p1  ORF type:complete len:407 (+),score=140.30 TRINITY_DN113_c0_g2_i1:293-1513(+)